MMHLKEQTQCCLVVFTVNSLILFSGCGNGGVVWLSTLRLDTKKQDGVSSQTRNADVQGRKGSEAGDTAGYLDKDTLRQEASQCGAAGRRTARQADVELW